MINKKGIKNLKLENINNSIILYDDTTNIDNVMCEYTNEYKFFSPEAMEFIDQNFKKNSNKKTFNGIIYGLISFETYGTKIFLNYEKSDFKTYLATINDEYKKYIKENNFFVIPIAVLGLIITKDNKIVMSNPTEFCEFNKFVGGFIDKKDIKEEQISIFHAIERECQEEIGDLKLFDNKIIGVVLGKCCTFISCSKTNYTSNEVLEINKKNKSEDSYEMKNMSFIDNNKNSIKEAISNLNFNSDGKIAIKLHLKESFEVYETMMINN